jgi:hypothetical protein
MDKKMTKQYLENQIHSNMELKSNTQLIDIWVNNNRNEWTDEAFLEIKDVLLSRNVKIPKQREWMQVDNHSENLHKLKYVNLLKIYWLGFGLYILFLSLLKYFMLTTKHELINNNLFVFIIWMMVIIVNVIEYSRVMKYFKTNYYRIWHDLTYVQVFGSRGNDDIKFIKFIFGFDSSKVKNIEDAKAGFVNVFLIGCLSLLALLFYFNLSN